MGISSCSGSLFPSRLDEISQDLNEKNALRFQKMRVLNDTDLEFFRSFINQSFHLSEVTLLECQLTTEMIIEIFHIFAVTPGIEKLHFTQCSWVPIRELRKYVKEDEGKVFPNIVEIFYVEEQEDLGFAII